MSGFSFFQVSAHPYQRTRVHQLWKPTLLQDDLLFSICQTSSTIKSAIFAIALAFSSTFWHNSGTLSSASPLGCWRWFKAFSSEVSTCISICMSILSIFHNSLLVLRYTLVGEPPYPPAPHGWLEAGTAPNLPRAPKLPLPPVLLPCPGPRGAFFLPHLQNHTTLTPWPGTADQQLLLGSKATHSPCQ